MRTDDKLIHKTVDIPLILGSDLICYFYFLPK
jgi:hypothetical protein